MPETYRTDIRVMINLVFCFPMVFCGTYTCIGHMIMHVKYKLLPNVDSADATEGGPALAGVVVVVESLVVVAVVDVVVELVVLLSLQNKLK